MRDMKGHFGTQQDDEPSAGAKMIMKEWASYKSTGCIKNLGIE